MSPRNKSRVSRGEPEIPVVDLFAGPGGLGEGFSSPTIDGQRSRFRIALSIEKDPIAHQTLELRAVFRQFEPHAAPEEYYKFLRGEIDRTELLNRRSMTAAAATAKREAWRAELGVTPAAEVKKRVASALAGADVSVLIGGPPCQAYSLVGRSRNVGNPRYDARADGRHTLYREYLAVLASQWPAVFVMENVKGLLSARLNGSNIFERIVDDLRAPASATTRPRGGYKYRILAVAAETIGQEDLIEILDPSDYVVRCEDHGVPQARHRVILLGIREDIDANRLRTLEKQRRVNAGDVLRDLPALRSGLSRETDSFASWHSVLKNSLQATWYRQVQASDRDVAERIGEAIVRAGRRRLTRGAGFVAKQAGSRAHADWYLDSRIGGTANHETRAHIPADIHRYLFAAAFAEVHKRSPVLADFPKALLPHHKNAREALTGSMFHDRFRVQLACRPSTTVTSHISKDGHYYIHYDPSQSRSLTVREAARLQTFPDNYFFCGGRTAQYHQVGNAVPPLLARQIAQIVSDLLS